MRRERLMSYSLSKPIPPTAFVKQQGESDLSWAERIVTYWYGPYVELSCQQVAGVDFVALHKLGVIEQAVGLPRQEVGIVFTDLFIDLVDERAGTYKPVAPLPEEQFHKKYDVRRLDGRDLPGGDREGAVYLVLDLKYSEHAVAAAHAYARSLAAAGKLALAKDIHAIADARGDRGALQQTEHNLRKLLHGATVVIPAVV